MLEGDFLMKKLILLLSAGLLMTALTGCQCSEKAAEPTDVESEMGTEMGTEAGGEEMAPADAAPVDGAAEGEMGTEGATEEAPAAEEAAE